MPPEANQRLVFKLSSDVRSLLVQFGSRSNETKVRKAIRCIAGTDPGALRPVLTDPDGFADVKEASAAVDLIIKKLKRSGEMEYSGMYEVNRNAEQIRAELAAECKSLGVPNKINAKRKKPTRDTESRVGRA